MNIELPPEQDVAETKVTKNKETAMPVVRHSGSQSVINVEQIVAATENNVSASYLGKEAKKQHKSKNESEEQLVPAPGTLKENRVDILKYDVLFQTCGIPSTSFQGYMGSLAKFLCHNCKTIVVVLWILPCLHQLCIACMIKAIKDGNVACYIDTTEHNFNELVEKTADTEELKNAIILCPNRRHGCKARFTIGAVKEHLDSCYYKYLSCPQNCGNVKIVKDLGIHLTKFCERRVYLCDGCEQDVQEKDRKVHEDTCEGNPIPLTCNYCGAEVIGKRQLRNHTEKCATKYRRCQLNILGCEFMGPNEEMDNHESLDNHRELIMNFICNTKEAITNLEQVRDAMTLQLSEAVGRLKNLDLTNRYLAVKVGILEELPYIQRDLVEDNKFLKKKVQELLEKQLAYEQQIARMAECCAGRLFEWVISGYSKKKDDEFNGGGRQNSPPFYTSYCGYRMRLSAYLNGNGDGRNTHLSVYFCIMRGINDYQLDWPFRNTVILQLVDRRHGTSHVRKCIQPNPHTVQDRSFQRPVFKSNVGRGFPRFISHDELEAPQSKYLLKDSIVITAEFESLK